MIHERAMPDTPSKFHRYDKQLSSVHQPWEKNHQQYILHLLAIPHLF